MIAFTYMAYPKVYCYMPTKIHGKNVSVLESLLYSYNVIFDLGKGHPINAKVFG